MKISCLSAGGGPTGDKANTLFVDNEDLREKVQKILCQFEWSLLVTDIPALKNALPVNIDISVIEASIKNTLIGLKGEPSLKEIAWNLPLIWGAMEELFTILGKTQGGKVPACASHIGVLRMRILNLKDELCELAGCEHGK
jgi:hypothetical protein